jgi:enoyl-CoA hydratase/carnithine racemase
LAEDLLVERRGPRLDLCLNRPAQRNALSMEVIEALTDELARVERDPEIRLVVVRAQGPSFCVGADLMSFAPIVTTEPVDREALRRIGRGGDALIWALAHLRATTVAAVQGHVVGGGFVLAAACDLRVAGSNARFSVPEVALGLPLAWLGVPLMQRELGASVARDLVLSGRTASAAELCELGFVHRLAASASPEEELDALVDTLLEQPAAALLAAGKQFKRPLADTAAREADIAAFVEAICHPEFLPNAMRYMQRLKSRS